MKYTIRYMAGVNGIESPHWKVWRPGAYEQPLRGFRSFAFETSLQDALVAVGKDIDDACRSYAGVTDYSDPDAYRDPTVAVMWWAAKKRNDWRKDFFELR